MPFDPTAAALLAAGGGLGQAAGPSRVPIGFGQALSQGAQAGLGGYLQAQQMGQQNRLADLQMLETMLTLQKQGREEEQRQRRAKAFAQYAKTLPEDQRALAEAAPDVAMKQLAESRFGTPTASKPQIFGSAETGYYSLAPGSSEPQKLVGGMGRAPGQEYGHYRVVGSALVDLRNPGTPVYDARESQGEDAAQKAWMAVYQNERRSLGANPRDDTDARQRADEVTQELFGQSPRTAAMPMGGEDEPPAEASSEYGWYNPYRYAEGTAADPWTWGGGGGEQPAAPATALADQPKLRQAAERAGASDLPRAQSGAVDPAGLVRGTTYRLPNGELATWDGQQFVGR